ncbi:RING finger protein 145-like [Protopterus annectens]|uniref:RING finger protein 145-like n=1 Tax=Protopterus annectens TaxID=7888 RepID=UPI001CFAF251|nr:RING finger protein 145-like [Protopterus annectens]
MWAALHSDCSKEKFSIHNNKGRRVVIACTCILKATFKYQDYIKHELEHGYQGAVFFDPTAFNCFASALTGEIIHCEGQIILSTLCSLLMKTKHFWLFSAPLLPLAARLCMVPLSTLPTVNNFAMLLTGLEVLGFLASGLVSFGSLLKSAIQAITQVLTDMSRLLAVVVSLWSYLAVPALFLVFWLVLFAFQLYHQVTSDWSTLTYQRLFFNLLNRFVSSSGEGKPMGMLRYKKIAASVLVRYKNIVASVLVRYKKIAASVLVRYKKIAASVLLGVTEGVSLLLLALQTGLTDMQLLQRTFLLSIILFIVVASTLQSMIEITNPIILALGASQSGSFWKHVRGISMCIFLLIFPCLMAYTIARLFHLDFWLLILLSSCMLTSLQVMGTIFIYTLFMLEPLRDEPLDKMDEIIYYVNAVSRVLEFLVAVCVVAYGTWESIIGEWSWVGASVIIIHSYFNVWLRAQSGWKSFLLRRDAANKIRSLPTASQHQLREHNDVCAICFQEMHTAVITPCEHFFHSGCLQKWLYVQDTCPMCHQQMKPPQQEAS